MTHILSDSYLKQFNTGKMPLHSESFNGTNNNSNHHHSFSSPSNKFIGLADATPATNSSLNLENFNKRYVTEETMIEILKSNIF